MDTSVVSQACGFVGRVAVDRPRITVLPVCMPQKTPQLLKLAASTRPVAKECESRISSPCVLVIGPSVQSALRKALRWGEGFSGEEELCEAALPASSADGVVIVWFAVWWCVCVGCRL